MVAALFKEGARARKKQMLPEHRMMMRCPTQDNRLESEDLITVALTGGNGILLIDPTNAVKENWSTPGDLCIDKRGYEALRFDAVIQLIPPARGIFWGKAG